MKADTSGLRRLAAALGDPNVARELEGIAREKADLAIISQAVADNFDKEGPGWAPLKGETLRGTVPKGMLRQAQLRAADAMGAMKINNRTGKVSVDKKGLKGDMAEFHVRTGEELQRMEAKVRQPGMETVEPGRKILQKSGLLKRTATTPNGNATFSETDKNGKVHTGSNIYRVEGTNITYGTNLIYAGTHNRGYPEKGIPARPFLVIRPEWMRDIYEYFARRAGQIIDKAKNING